MPSASNTVALSPPLTPKNSLAAPISMDSSSGAPVSSQSLSTLSMLPSKFYTFKYSHIQPNLQSAVDSVNENYVQIEILLLVFAYVGFMQGVTKRFDHTLASGLNLDNA